MTRPEIERVAKGLPYEPNMMDRRPVAVEEAAAVLAWQRGGQTHPLSSYDLDLAEEQVTGEVNLRAENKRLRRRIAELERTVA